MMDDQPRIERDTAQARGGVTGHNASTVLVLSIVAVIVGFAAVYFYYFAR